MAEPQGKDRNMMKKLLMFFAMITLIVVVVTATVRIFAHMGVQDRATQDLQFELVRVREQQQFLFASFCNETNMRSRKPQELSYTECMDYARKTYLEMKKVPTPTVLEHDTTRRGLGKPEPTPCSGELPCGNKKLS